MFIRNENPDRIYPSAAYMDSRLTHYAEKLGRASGKASVVEIKLSVILEHGEMDELTRTYLKEALKIAQEIQVVTEAE